MRLLRMSSLKSLLVVRFAIVMGLLLVLMNAGFVVFVALVTPSTNGADERAVSVVVEALSEADGDLIARETDGLRTLRERYPAFWFVALKSDGNRVTYGSVPSLFASVVDRLSEVHSLDLRGANGAIVTAQLKVTNSEIGEVKILYGGNPVPGSNFLNLLWGAKVIYIPFIVLPVIGIFLALPLLVERALAGLKRTTSTASLIDADRLGVRLSKEGVVDELHPLVTAINAALARIDDDFSGRQRFFANAAHELRTPIAILQTRLEGLEAGAQRDRLLQDVARLAAMAEQLLDMQRLGSSRDWSDVDLVSTCEQVAADCGPLAIFAGYDLEFHAEVSSFKIKGDRTSLERAIANLIRNAIEHGGGHGTIRVEVLRDGTIEVADEGPGIPEGEEGRIFEPFYRTKPKSTGAGLGLSIVEEIIRAHNGQVTVIQQEKGARFRLRVPPPRVVDA